MLGDSLFGLAEIVTQWVDDRYGRTAEWMAAIIMPIVVIGLTMGMVVVGLAWMF